MIGQVKVWPAAEDVARQAAEWLIGRVAAAPAPVRVALSGGSTPKQMFSLLAARDLAARMHWDKLHLFWGDERYVPYDNADSNYGQARQLLLDHVPIPAAQVHPFPCGPDPEHAALAYARTLREAYGAATLDPAHPLFQVVFLGLGEDGHTASLIPGQEILNERTRWTGVVGHGRPEVRLTLTYPALNSAHSVVFLVTGAGKREILGKLRAGADVPAARIAPVGETLWFMDQAAS